MRGRTKEGEKIEPQVTGTTATSVPWLRLTRKQVVLVRMNILEAPRGLGSKLECARVPRMRLCGNTCIHSCVIPFHL